jgi:hypothetical protein
MNLVIEVRDVKYKAGTDRDDICKVNMNRSSNVAVKNV